MIHIGGNKRKSVGYLMKSIIFFGGSGLYEESPLHFCEQHAGLHGKVNVIPFRSSTNPHIESSVMFVPPYASGVTHPHPVFGHSPSCNRDDILT
jgi:hypothetical protein